jgi:prepilin-type N-terminal cleavage/methylation domain-containing protein
MQMSDICRPNKRRVALGGRRRRNADGFTLVEILVVLLIMGLLASITVPNLQRLYNSVQHDAEREEALGAITGLSYHAYVTGLPVTLPSGRTDLKFAQPQPKNTKPGVDADTPIDDEIVFPAGWQLELTDPIAFNFLGICSGGKLKLIAPDGSEEGIVLKGPRCDVALPPDTL